MDSSINLDTLRTQGIRKHLSLQFTFHFSGEQVNELRQLLEQLAAPNGNYLGFRQAVFYAELIRDQAKSQGF
jgi:hypothetical protein